VVSSAHHTTGHTAAYRNVHGNIHDYINTLANFDANRNTHRNDNSIDRSKPKPVTWPPIPRKLVGGRGHFARGKVRYNEKKRAVLSTKNLSKKRNADFSLPNFSGLKFALPEGYRDGVSLPKYPHSGISE
jgi:hypothetical protein